MKRSFTLLKEFISFVRQVYAIELSQPSWSDLHWKPKGRQLKLPHCLSKTKATETGSTGIMSTQEYTGQFTWQCSPASADGTTNPQEGESPTCREPRCQKKVSLSGSTTAHMSSYLASSFPIPAYNLTLKMIHTLELALFWWSIPWENEKKCCRNVRTTHFLPALAQQKCRASMFVLPVTSILLQFV